MKRLSSALVLLAALAGTAAAANDAAPKPTDFAWGMSLSAADGRPLQELVLPDVVYAGVSRDDLGDLRVFNAEGAVVPHALCTEPKPIAPRSERAELPLYPLLQGDSPRQALGARIELQTAGGTQLQITEPGTEAPAPRRLRGYILDASLLQDPVRALHLDWDGGGVSEVKVSVAASVELDDWRTLVGSATLLHSESGGRSLTQGRIALPEGRYTYLRIEGADAEVPVLKSVQAETIRRSELPPAAWFGLQQVDSDAQGWLYHADRRAPVDSAVIQLPGNNMTVEAELSSRADGKGAWIPRWRGEVFQIGDGERQRRNLIIRFAPTHDRHWRLQVLRGRDSLRGQVLPVELGYSPARLHFLAQGGGPWRLAYGSGRVGGAPAACGSLLRELGGRDVAELTGAAQAEAPESLGGADAYRIPPQPTPLKQILLWVALAAGALLLAGMALSLLRRVKRPAE